MDVEGLDVRWYFVSQIPQQRQIYASRAQYESIFGLFDCELVARSNTEVFQNLFGRSALPSGEILMYII